MCKVIIHYQSTGFFWRPKPSGKPEKPTGIIFLTGSHQKSPDRNRSTGITNISWRSADRNQFLTDGLRLAGQNLLLSVQLSGIFNRQESICIPDIWSCQENLPSRQGLDIPSFSQYPTIIHICALYNIYTSTCRSHQTLNSTHRSLQFNHRLT